MQLKHGHVWKADWIWLIACGLLSSAYCVSTAAHMGPTFDEPGYLLQGLERWRLGSTAMLMKMGTMPLPIDVTTLPLYIWELLRGKPFDPVSDIDMLLPIARAGTLVFWWVLLFYGWKIGKSIAGNWAGLLAVTLLASEPSLLAHASLATTDVAITACMLAFAYHFRKGRTSSWWLRAGLPALLYGLALLAKASALVMGPVCMLAIEFERLVSRQTFKMEATGGFRQLLRQTLAEIRPFIRDSVQIVCLGFAVMLIYCGSDWRTQASFVTWAGTLPDGPMASIMVYLSEHLRIFSNGAEGIVRQIGHGARGHGMFIAGETHPRAIWYYFPVAMTVKLAVPMLILPLLVAIVRLKALWNWVTLTTGALLLFSFTFRVQIGIRLVLPIVGFFVTGLAGAVVNMITALEPGWKKRLTSASAACCILWVAISAIFVWPNALCYTNEFWGGTSKGYLQLSDSNYDWGQGLRELREWRRNNRVENLYVWYFGTDPAYTSGDFKQLIMRNENFSGPDDLTARFHGSFLAVSTTWLHGGYILENPKKGQVVDKSSLIAVRYLRTKQPVARTATFLIYDFTGELVAGILTEGNFQR